MREESVPARHYYLRHSEARKLTFFNELGVQQEHDLPAGSEIVDSHHVPQHMGGGGGVWFDYGADNWAREGLEKGSDVRYPVALCPCGGATS